MLSTIPQGGIEENDGSDDGRARGKGHCAVHETGIHGGPPVKVIKGLAAAAFVFGAAVLIGEFIVG